MLSTGSPTPFSFQAILATNKSKFAAPASSATSPRRIRIVTLPNYSIQRDAQTSYQSLETKEPKIEHDPQDAPSLKEG